MSLNLSGRGVQHTATHCSAPHVLFLSRLQVIFMTGWAPSGSTPQAAERGSATVSFHEMADALAKKGALAGSIGEGQGEGDRSSSGGSSESSSSSSSDEDGSGRN